MGGYFQYLTELRDVITKLNNTIEDAAEDISLDTSKSNLEIRIEIEELIEKFLKKASRFGLYVIEYHGNYRIPKFVEKSPEINKIASHRMVHDMYNINIQPKDPRFFWTEYMLSYEDVEACRICSIPYPHSIIRESLFAAECDQEKCLVLQNIWSSIFSAKKKAAEKSPRSSIREHLLRALILINDEIIPFNLDEYISKQRNNW